MTPITLTLVADGSSDACLTPIIEWAVQEYVPHLPFRLQFADRHLPPLRQGLRSRIIAALKLFPCRILLIHRDAEARPAAERIAEISEGCVDLAINFVAVVPVRMSEAWLFSDEGAIRTAANNPNGEDTLDLPELNSWEDLPNPKLRLFEVLRRATGLGAHRRARFDVHHARRRVSQLTAEFAALRNLGSFQAFETNLRTALDAVA